MVIQIKLPGGEVQLTAARLSASDKRSTPKEDRMLPVRRFHQKNAKHNNTGHWKAKVETSGSSNAGISIPFRYFTPFWRAESC